MFETPTDCKRLKCLFSIPTRGSFPQLSILRISDAPVLEQVFGGKQGATRELHIKVVFPELFVIYLGDVPKLHTICPAIDFQTVICRLVEGCPKLSLTSTDNVDFINSYTNWFQESESKKGNMDEDDLFEQLINRVREVVEKVTKRDRPAAQQTNGSSNIKEITKASVEDGPKAEEAAEADEGKDSEQTSNNPAPSQRLKEVAEKLIKRDQPVAEQNNGSSNIKEMTGASVEDSLKPEEAAPFAAPSQIESPRETLKSTSQEGSKSDEVVRAYQIMSPESSKPSPKAFVVPLEKEHPHIKETAEVSDEDTPQPEEATESGSEQTNKPAPFAAPSQIESPQSERGLHSHSKDPQSEPSELSSNIASSEDNMDRIEDEGKKITLDQQALPKTDPDMHLDDSQKKLMSFDATQNAKANVEETSDKVAMSIPSTTATETSSPLIPSISTPMKPQIATSSTETKAESSQSDHLDISITESAQDENKVTQAGTCMPHVSKQLENDDLMILFQIMEEVADIEVHMPYASQVIAYEDDSEVAKALGDLEASMKMGLEEIASSEESKLCLENALNTLSSHCSDDGLKAIIHSLQQEIQNVLSSFKLQQKQKLMTEQCLQRKGAAMSLLSEIQKTQNSMVEAQKKAAELKEQIFKLQTELDSKENEIKECDNKLLSLEKQKKESVSDTIGFIKELEAVKKKRSQLENMDFKWSSCLANLKKTSLLLGVHLKQKL
ncbi:eisosome protein 1-like [Neltuma alba]|uniref:eisosome protein 1-like n=1 Tax=Neltuma alba TaxID=207710 RepID=UPI0010A483F1|nr:eisosome protein 1-like [Prosopis alba]